MPTLISAPLPELDWPTLTTILVDAGDPNAVVESLIILVSEDAPVVPATVELLPPVLAHEAPGFGPGG